MIDDHEVIDCREVVDRIGNVGESEKHRDYSLLVSSHHPKIGLLEPLCRLHYC